MFAAVKKREYLTKKHLTNVLNLRNIAIKNCEKKKSSDQEKNLKFKAEGWEFAKFLGSLEHFIQTVKGQNNFW